MGQPERGYAETTAAAPTKTVSFSEALNALKSGKKVTRHGWNGKGMWLYLVPGSTFKVQEGRPLAAHLQIGEEVNYGSHIDMRTAAGSHVPWIASQTDLLAEDWEVL
jgi:hypothetical protein